MFSRLLYFNVDKNCFADNEHQLMEQLNDSLSYISSVTLNDGTVIVTNGTKEYAREKVKEFIINTLE